MVRDCKLAIPERHTARVLVVPNRRDYVFRMKYKPGAARGASCLSFRRLVSDAVGEGEAPGVEKLGLALTVELSDRRRSNVAEILDMVHVMADFDVAIVGGGPGGSTLAALLGRRGRIKVGVFEKEIFPREHIGESFAHRAMPILAHSGALERVLASDCWVKKYGGYYVWDAQAPSPSLFENESFRNDGIYRWAIHVNRAEFDHILLDHAADCGAVVSQGCAVQSAQREAELWRVHLRDGRSFTARCLVEASGRQTSLVSGQKREFLSQYKNIAIWTHVLGGRPAQSLEGEWNIFRKDDLSAIGSFAFEDGWFWYIPVPKTINGERVLTHSLGLVTDPETLKARRDAYLDPDRFMATAKRVPLLEHLVRDAALLPGKLHTATNYSMISQRFCDLEQRWLLLGDSAYFVDPLFSSGVAFALNQAATAAVLIEAALGTTLGQRELFDLWRDHDESWHRIARGFALMIDQWYHGIANSNPESRHWRERAAGSHAELRSTTLHALVDTDISPDLIDVITKNSGVLEAGPLLDFRETRPSPPAPEAWVRVALDAKLWSSAGLGLELLRRPVPPDKRAALAAWWQDPVANRDALPPPFAAPVPCLRLARDDAFTMALYASEAESLRSLAAGAPYSEWAKAFESSPVTLSRLWESGLLERHSEVASSA